MSPQELKKARRKLGLNQAALGASIGVSASQVYSMEHGRRDIGLLVELAVRYRLIETGLAVMADFAEGSDSGRHDQSNTAGIETTLGRSAKPITTGS